MTTAFTRRTWGSSLLIAGMVIPAVAVGGSAFAAPTCTTTIPAATLVASGVCQVVITSDGTFTPPSGVAKMGIVLVGAGGGALGEAGSGYAGGGGEVRYVDATGTLADLAIVVGVGGAAAITMPALDGSETSVGGLSVAGGQAASTQQSGASGSGQLGLISDFDSPGGGAKTAATAGAPATAGEGYALSGIPGVDPELFPPAADAGFAFGRGGDNLDNLGDTSTSAGVSFESSGNGGGYDVFNRAAIGVAAGADGVVIIRFPSTDDGAEPVAPDADSELAATGADGSTLLVGTLGFALLVAGAVATARSRRTATA